MGADLGDLERLRQAERAKRLIIVGSVALLYGVGWLLFDSHSIQIGVSEGKVSRIYQDVHYTVDHEVRGVEYSAYPGRIPDSMGRPPVGSPIRIFYYRNDPQRAFFEERRHAWPQPIPAAVAVLGLFALAEGVRRGLLSRGRTEPSSDLLELPVSTMSWLRTIGGGVFLVLLGVVVVLSTWLGWETGGPLGMAALVMVVGGHGGMVVSVFAIAFVSSLVFDPGRGLVYEGWGLRRPWFRSYKPLDTLKRLEIRMKQFRRSTVYLLVLHFEDGSEWIHPGGPGQEAASRTQDRIRQYLAARSITLS